MACLVNSGGAICGNFAKLTKRKPKNWYETGYKIIVPFTFKWRHKIGNVKCTCKNMEEHYQPYYGWSWFHEEGCAYVEVFKKRPQLCNLNPFYGKDIDLIAMTD